jgi:hypothetical protein
MRSLKRRLARLEANAGASSSAELMEHAAELERLQALACQIWRAGVWEIVPFTRCDCTNPLCHFNLARFRNALELLAEGEVQAPPEECCDAMPDELRSAAFGEWMTRRHLGWREAFAVLEQLVQLEEVARPRTLRRTSIR